VSPAGGKKRKTVPNREGLEKTKKRRQEVRRQWLQERPQYNETVVKACLLKYIKNPYKQKLRDAIRNHVDSYSKSIT
jgi:hypothetical protein